MIDYESLIARLKLSVPDVDIMINTLPISSTKGIFIRSSISGDMIDYEIPGLSKARFRLIARAAKYGEGMELLNKAIMALTIHRPTDVGNMYVRYCRPETTPMIFPISDGNLREFAVNMEICYDYDVKNVPWASQQL